MQHMNYTHFSKSERIELSILLKKGYSLRSIAGALSRSPSSVSRELKRNKVKKHYDGLKANHKAYVKRKYSKYQGMKIREHPELEAFVRLGMESHWTPDEISQRWRLLYPDLAQVSHRAIYKYLYSQYGQRWCIFLASKHWKRYKHRSSKQSPWKHLNRILVDQRPLMINSRKRLGDFEGDTLGVPKKTRTTIVGVVDRKSRYFVAKKVRRLKYTVATFRSLLKSHNARSLTLDNGVENIRFKDIGVKTYFCHPYHSWEKGSIENTFQRLRRFIPKRASIVNYSSKQVSAMVKIMNQTPRKCLGYRTPEEVFFRRKSLPSVLHLRG